MDAKKRNNISSSDMKSGQTEPKNRRESLIALLAAVGISLHLILRYGFQNSGQISSAWHGVSVATLPLVCVLILGGTPLVFELLQKLVHREFGADLLAGISIVTSLLLGEYLAGALVVLMLSGGEALEAYALQSASSALQALANRMPTVAHRREGERLVEVPLEAVQVGDVLVVMPHALCPVDGSVLEGHGTMDESYLTGEPYQISKAPGTSVLSGAINGDTALTIRCERPAGDSRYARIMRVMRDSEEKRPHIRRLGDQIGAWYTPLAVGIALVAWLVTHDPTRFLAVLVVATPCPLLIAIPTAIIGAISLSARMGIIIKNPAVLEKISTCRVAIFDKTGTLTYGRPKLTDILISPSSTTIQQKSQQEILALVASVERYSKHPLAGAILDAANAAGLPLQEVGEVREEPGEGLRARVAAHQTEVTGRNQFQRRYPEQVALLPPVVAGMECLVLVDGQYAATLRFRDEPRQEGGAFIQHLSPKHRIERLMLVSGDREAEVAYLAEKVGIREVFSSQSPEQKLELVRRETAAVPTLFLGDGINDAPALTAATVGVAFGNKSEVTGEAADAVILDSSLGKVDVLLHIGQRMRRIALQSAIGGMALSGIGMVLAAFGHLMPVAGAMLQEVIDVLAILNALRAAFPPRALSDY